MSRYAEHINPSKTPQSQPLLGENQVKNSAGGYVYKIDKWTRLDRFLILGSDAGSYYATPRALTQENAKCVLDCAKEDGFGTLRRILAISKSGRAPRNDPAIFALALLMSPKFVDDDLVRQDAGRIMPEVCRTGSHLLQFVDTVTQLRGWGRSLKTSVATWYESQTPQSLAYQVTKYKQRGGWSHQDVLRLAHPKSRINDEVLQYVAIGATAEAGRFENQPPAHQTEHNKAHYLLAAVEQAKQASTAKEIVSLILNHGLVREHIPTQWLNEVTVWDALLDNMPVMAMLRNLGKMGSVGLLSPLSDAARTVCDALRSSDRLKRARIHPMHVLLALSTYQAGKGVRGKLSWSPVQPVLDALDDAFSLAFSCVESTDKRWLLGLDVSGSMGWALLNNTHLSAREAAAAMMMTTVRTEPQFHAVAFTSQLSQLQVSARDSIDSVVRRVSQISFGRTDCAQPMIYALRNKIPVDVFVVYTDNETWCGAVHPVQALREYRQRMGIDAKLIVVGMTATDFSIADRDDSGMLDVVGFDANAPAVMRDFVVGGTMR